GADAVGDQLVVGAAEDDGGDVVRGERGGRGDGLVDRRVVRALHGLGQSPAGHLGDGDVRGEPLDQVALVGAARGGGGGPDGERSAAGRGRLDGGDGADDRKVRLVAGAQGGEGVHGGGVAADDQGVGPVHGGRLGDGQGAPG